MDLRRVTGENKGGPTWVGRTSRCKKERVKNQRRRRKRRRSASFRYPGVSRTSLSGGDLILIYSYGRNKLVSTVVTCPRTISSSLLCSRRLKKKKASRAHVCDKTGQTSRIGEKGRGRLVHTRTRVKRVIRGRKKGGNREELPGRFAEGRGEKREEKSTRARRPQ